MSRLNSPDGPATPAPIRIPLASGIGLARAGLFDEQLKMASLAAATAAAKRDLPEAPRPPEPRDDGQPAAEAPKPKANGNERPPIENGPLKSPKEGQPNREAPSEPREAASRPTDSEHDGEGRDSRKDIEERDEAEVAPTDPADNGRPKTPSPARADAELTVSDEAQGTTGAEAGADFPQTVDVDSPDDAKAKRPRKSASHEAHVPQGAGPPAITANVPEESDESAGDHDDAQDSGRLAAIQPTGQATTATAMGAPEIAPPRPPSAQAERHGEKDAPTGEKGPAPAGRAAGAPPAQPSAPAEPVPAPIPAHAAAGETRADPAAAVGSVAAVQVEGAAPSRSADSSAPVDAAAASRTSAARGTQRAGNSSEPGAQEGQIDRVRFVQRVARAFQSLRDGGGSIRLRLRPPELGSLHIEMSVRQGAMTARLEVENHAARSALLDSLPALRERLAQQDIRVERFDIDVAGDTSREGVSQGPGGGSEPPERSAQRSASPRKDRAPEEAATAPATHARAGDGALLNVIV